MEDIDQYTYRVKEGDNKMTYFQFKVTPLNVDDLKIVQIVDITHQILYTESKAQNEFLQLINATVSHELRNPSNSLKAQNILKANLYKKLQAILTRYDIDTSECDRILIELNDGLDVQDSSANLMSYMIQDLLDFSQIKGGKFRKNVKAFNIRDAVYEIMKLQQRKAQEKGIEFTAIFENIAFDSRVGSSQEESAVIMSD